MKTMPIPHFHLFSIHIFLSRFYLPFFGFGATSPKCGTKQWLYGTKYVTSQKQTILAYLRKNKTLCQLCTIGRLSQSVTSLVASCGFMTGNSAVTWLSRHRSIAKEAALRQITLFLTRFRQSRLIWSSEPDDVCTLLASVPFFYSERQFRNFNAFLMSYIPLLQSLGIL